jgi:RHS repeat-associated protein
LNDAFGDQSMQGPGAFYLRFPGQYFDVETGLNFNNERNYDPTTGRYLQSDPMGLLAGPSTYGYANNSPLINVDPLGLAPNLNVFPQWEPIWGYAQQVPSVPNAYIVAGHGTPTYMLGPDGIKGLTAQAIASMIESDMDYQQGEQVILDSCNTGNDSELEPGQEPFAQQLADLLGAPVVAPNEFGWYYQDGTVITADSEIPSTSPYLTAQQAASGPSYLSPGQWITYLPSVPLTQ